MALQYMSHTHPMSGVWQATWTTMSEKIIMKSLKLNYFFPLLCERWSWVLLPIIVYLIPHIVFFKQDFHSASHRVWHVEKKLKHIPLSYSSLNCHCILFSDRLPCIWSISYACCYDLYNTLAIMRRYVSHGVALALFSLLAWSNI